MSKKKIAKSTSICISNAQAKYSNGDQIIGHGITWPPKLLTDKLAGVIKFLVCTRTPQLFYLIKLGKKVCGEMSKWNRHSVTNCEKVRFTKKKQLMQQHETNFHVGLLVCYNKLLPFVAILC
jgi:hypothetical protein